MNLRKDHYRSTAPALVRALSPRARCTLSAAARALCADTARGPKAFQTRARRESGWRRARRGRRAPACLAPRLRPGTAVGARPSLPLFFFRSLRRPPLVCGRVPARASGPGSRPRSPGTTHSGPPPTARSGPPHGYAQLAWLLRSPWRGVQSPRRRQRRPRGARRSRRLDTLTHSRLRTRAHSETKKQLLAVDHSAHASMKNAASCEK